MERIIYEKDNVLLKLQSDFSEYSAEKIMKDNASQAQNQFNTLSNEIADLKQGNVELQKRYEQVCSERNYLTRSEDKLASTLI